MSNEKREYPNKIVAGAWATRNGSINTMPLDERAVEALKNAHVGGKILVRKRSEQSIADAKNPETTPQYYIEFVPADEVVAFQEAKVKRNQGRGL